MTHPLAAVQQSLGEASRAAWSALEQDLRSRPPLVHAPGARLVFVGLDPTMQIEHHSAGRSIVLRHGHERFLFPIDKKLSKRLGELRDLQTLFGWPIGRETAWNAVADIVATRQLEPADPPDPNAPTVEHELELRQIYVPDQLMLADEMPGLEEALAQLDATLPRIVLPDNALPEDLIALLPQILTSHHWKAFDALCAPDFAKSDRRMAFEQFRQAWGASGALSFEGYDRDPNAKYELDVVRTMIRRNGSKPGEVFVRPLLWVKRDGGWRYAGGIL